MSLVSLADMAKNSLPEPGLFGGGLIPLYLWGKLELRKAQICFQSPAGLLSSLPGPWSLDLDFEMRPGGHWGCAAVGRKQTQTVSPPGLFLCHHRLGARWGVQMARTHQFSSWLMALEAPTPRRPGFVAGSSSLVSSWMHIQKERA